MNRIKSLICYLSFAICYHREAVWYVICSIRAPCGRELFISPFSFRCRSPLSRKSGLPISSPRLSCERIAETIATLKTATPASRRAVVSRRDRRRGLDERQNGSRPRPRQILGRFRASQATHPPIAGTCPHRVDRPTDGKYGQCRTDNPNGNRPFSN
jgi:hypothetical protein